MTAFIPIAAIGALAAAGLSIAVIWSGQNKSQEEINAEDKEQMEYLQKWSDRKRR